VPSTAVVRGNLTNAVLSLVDTISQNHPLMAGDAIPMGLSVIAGAFLGTDFENSILVASASQNGAANRVQAQFRGKPFERLMVLSCKGDGNE